MFAGHVEEIDSDIERLANDGYSLRSVLINTKVVAAQPDDRRPDSGAPKFSHFHTKTPYSSLRENRDGDDFPGPGLKPFGMGAAHDAIPVLMNQRFCAAMNSSVAATQACTGKTFSVKTQ